MNFFISGKVENFRKKKTGKWAIFTQHLLQIITIRCIKYFASFRKHNQQFHSKIIDYFFHKELRNPKIEMDPYLSFLKRNAS